MGPQFFGEHQPVAGEMVRYAHGQTGLMIVTSTHAGGWHGPQCMGGNVFGHQFRKASARDRRRWVETSKWRQQTQDEAAAQIGFPTSDDLAELSRPCPAWDYPTLAEAKAARDAEQAKFVANAPELEPIRKAFVDTPEAKRAPQERPDDVDRYEMTPDTMRRLARQADEHAVELVFYTLKYALIAAIILIVAVIGIVYACKFIFWILSTAIGFIWHLL